MFTFSLVSVSCQFLCGCLERDAEAGAIFFCYLLIVLSGWPLTWKTWKSQGKVVRENGKRETEICILDFERAEELKLQLLAACGPGFWICSSLTLL